MISAIRYFKVKAHNNNNGPFDGECGITQEPTS